MKFKIISIASLLLLNILAEAKVTAQENSPSKNGNPCIEEICINDDIKSIPPLNWRKVRVSNEDGSQFLQAIGDRAAIKTYSRYWLVRQIDGVGVAALAKIKGFCKNPLEDSTMAISGVYTNKKGMPVLVVFHVVPSEDAKSQKIIVARIEKAISMEKTTPEQTNDLENQAKARYPDYYPKSAGSSQYPMVVVSDSLGYPTITLTSQYTQILTPGITINPTKFKYFPGCGSEKRMKL